jgi:methyl-accepting chemotaxis protein
MVTSKIGFAKQTSEQNSAAAKDANQAMLILTILAIIGVIVAVGIGMIIAAVVRKQLGGDPKQVGDIANLVAVGDLTSEITLPRATAPASWRQ